MGVKFGTLSLRHERKTGKKNGEGYFDLRKMNKNKIVKITKLRLS